MSNNPALQLLEHRLQDFGFRFFTASYKDETAFEKQEYTNMSLTLDMNNGRLQKGPFYFNEENDFVHWTSQQSLYAILQSKTLRLYNLLKMDDPLEMEHGLKELKFPDHVDLEKEKEQIFSLSMCSYPVVNADHQKKHLLWKLYGQEGEGVMLRFSFSNNMELWNQYHLSRVYYETAGLEVIKELHELTENIFLDPKVSCFIKHRIYGFEEEVRLIFDARDDRAGKTVNIENVRLHPIIQPDCLTSDKNICFVEVPISNLPFQHGLPSRNYLQASNEIPHIRLTEIVLGYRFNASAVNRASEQLKRNGINIPVRRSDLSQYYSSTTFNRLAPSAT